MNTPMDTPVNFRQRLGDELAARAAARPVLSPTPVRPRHTGRIAVTSLGLAAAVTAVVLGTHTGTAPATPHAAPASPSAGNSNSAPALGDVGYTVTVRPGHVVALEITGTKLSGLQAALRRAGLPAVVLSPSATCPAKVTPVDTSHLGQVMSLDPKNGRVALLDPGAVPHGDTLLVVDEAPPGALHRSVGSLAVMLTNPAPACFPSSQVDIGEG
ncbi:hypothetical protein [Streptacidiphilus jiangxiensis]|uniref:Uncharacterized protein n=1 Tax=Streptacidiphilus jiangxiensis TaxID=235985 RepID=A0A1H7PLH1_STRJI|nr:hypothetical protein [Streptacidiphilus jiangxiensis]SEL36469.1 hypothetical protein SAMN05414137_10811 [Streptacidiphilus jiangxiensis]